LAAAEARGDPPPPGIFDAPQVDILDEFYWRAFVDLSSCRVNGMGLGAIPWTAIRTYAKEYEVVDFDFFYDVIRMTDEGYLQHIAEQQEQRQRQQERQRGK